MQIVPPDFVMFQNLKQHIACITMQSNAYQPIKCNRVFTNFQTYIFNVHRIPLQAENSTFFSDEDTGKNTTQNAPKRHF